MQATKHLTIMGALLALLAAARAAAETATEAFFRPPPDRSRDHDPDRVYSTVRLGLGPFFPETAGDPT
jgi:hypothetical protein